jgi:predicted helicase
MSVWETILKQIFQDWQQGFGVLLYQVFRDFVVWSIVLAWVRLLKKLFVYLQTVIKKKPLMLQTYLDQITQTYLRGDAREESYYETLSVLLKQFAESQKAKCDITTLPKKTEAGNPDFRVWDGKQHIIGYVEAKDPMVKDLDRIESSEQLKRYRSTFPNVILTNFLEFRLYRDGELTQRVTIGEPHLLKKIGTAPLKNKEELEALLEKFFSFSIPKVYSAKQLAEELAKRTRFLRDEVLQLELDEETREGKAITGFYEGFKKYLVATLTKEQFADLYAQTITYGLFAARTRAGDAEFTRRSAFDFIPNTIGILRDVFEFISLGKPPRALEILVDDIAEVLRVTEVNKILDCYYEEGKGQDPIIHFYETFLAKYDPTVRERRGVYYTPEPVVHYITKSLHHLLKTRFNKPDGFASEGVTVLDPAGGTLTFPAEAIKLAVDEYTTKYGTGGQKGFIKNHILKNFFAFELMMAPYAIGHLKIGFLLEELGYHMTDEERFPLYLTNTLEMEELEQIQIPGLGSLSEESHLAGKVKKHQPILVIMGNPPYSGISSNINEWTEKLLKEDIDGVQSYYKVDGKPLGEKKLWLQDDYVKFLRFSQWKIAKTGHGIVGMITNHSYLDNPTFRGMRQSLMSTFDEIFIINLHGNTLKKETTPEGGKDENVFDIRQGTAIILMVKMEKPLKKDCQVHYHDQWGSREVKYDWLDTITFTKTKFEVLRPESPWYFMIPRNIHSIKKYESWPILTDIFPINNVGIVTARDKFSIDFDQSILENRIRQFQDIKNYTDELIRSTYDLKDTSTFKLNTYREIASKEDRRDYLREILYRPFDSRIIYYSKSVVERPISDLMNHMLSENTGLVIGRQGQVVGDEHLWNLALISNSITDFNLFYRGGGMLFPLYLYPPKDGKKKTKAGQMLMFMEPDEEYVARRPNISKATFEHLTLAYGSTPSPENIFYYIYAVLYSPTYRTKYAEFLKIDFPRVPFAKTHKVFLDLAVLGERLASIHLLKSTELDTPIVRYMGEGDDDVIVKPEYHHGTVRINSSKYFEGVTEELWNYHIGGYQVLHKYLKDRKGRKMDDPRHYCRMVTALAKTIELQKEIDVLFGEVEKGVIEWERK